MLSGSDFPGMKKILLFADWYEPGYKAGGPIRSCVNFARAMSESYQVYVFTSDRDLGSPSPYGQVKLNEWQDGPANIHLYYCSPEKLGWRGIRRQIDLILPDFVYLNSMFSTKFTIYPLLISRFQRRDLNIVLSPRGMLRASAIQFKTAKKKIFLKSLRLLGLHRSIRFHATDPTEALDIQKYFGPATRVSTVPNFPGILSEDWPAPLKMTGQLSMIFIGRIHPIKNLDFLLRVLKEVRTTVQLTIIGSLEDEPYWENCQKIIAELPLGIRVDYAGEIANHALPAIVARHHIFALPTKGENFGHAIFEALALGKPVLISDQTPWRDLQAAGAGWDLPLDNPARFREAIDQVGDWPQDEYEKWRRSTRQYIQDYINRLNLKEEYKKLFS